MRHEVRRYTNARLAGPVENFERSRFMRRMIGVVILTIVLAMTYLGYINKNAFAGHPWVFAIYWIPCILLTFSLFGLALIDMRAVFKQVIRKYMDEDGENQRLEQFLIKEKEKVKNKPTESINKT